MRVRNRALVLGCLASILASTAWASVVVSRQCSRGGAVETWNQTESLAVVRRILSSEPSAVVMLDAFDEDDSIGGGGESTGLLRAYFAGAKRLWGEVGVYRRVRRCNSHELSWRERRIAAEVPVQVARMLPLLVNPLPPPFGLVLIAVASAAPRYLLTRQFWTLDQCRRFSDCDSRRTRKRLQLVLEACSETLAKGVRFSGPATPLVSLVDLFGNPPLALDSLSRKHLVRLAKAQRLYPAWILPLIRTKRLRRALAARARLNDEDDAALRADFANLEPRHLFDACAARGLKVDGDDRARARRLAAWLDARDAVLHAVGNDPIPPSFVLHMPAIFAGLADAI